MAANILLIEDEADTAALMGDGLRKAGFEVTPVQSARAGLTQLMKRTADCVLLDYRLPDGDGLTCLGKIRQSHPRLPVIVITGSGSEHVAVEAMKLGAADYVVKHGHYLESMAAAVKEALGRRELDRSLEGSPAPSAAGSETLTPENRAHYRRAGIIGNSRAILEATALANRAARSCITVLLEGETGTGKDLFARAIHGAGPRRERPFVVQNCAALPEPLLETELFGHARGAFTGADRERRGLFEEADGGTLFLDEITEMGLTGQAKLLRVLEDRTVRRMGATGMRRVDTRVIAATNCDLAAAVDEGRFRQDLYYRLRVFPIRLPPLRDRPEDIPLLAEHFLEELGTQEGGAFSGFDTEASRLLRRYPWPGNVRELRNEIHRLVLCAPRGRRVTSDMLTPSIVRETTSACSMAQPLKEIVRHVELATIRDRLRTHGYHRVATARSLGMTRESLWAKLRQLGIVLPLRGGGS